MKEFVRKSENMEQCIWVIPYIIRGGGISKSNELQVQEGVRLLPVKYCFDFTSILNIFLVIMRERNQKIFNKSKDTL